MCTNTEASLTSPIECLDAGLPQCEDSRAGLNSLKGDKLGAEEKNVGALPIIKAVEGIGKESDAQLVGSVPPHVEGQVDRVLELEISPNDTATLDLQFAIVVGPSVLPCSQLPLIDVVGAS